MSVVKRLEALERIIQFRQPRQIVILVDGNKDDSEAVHALLKELDVQDNELVVCVSKFVDTDDLPRIASIH
jgi:hypothetical protein